MTMMMRILKFFFSTEFCPPKNFILPKIPSSHLSTRPNSWNKRPSRKPSASKKSSTKVTSPPLLQRITDLVGSEDPSFSLSNGTGGWSPNKQDGTATVCQIAQQSSNLNRGQTHLIISNVEDVSPMVHRVTEILRSEDATIPVEQRLDEMDIVFSPEIVEKVLKRCFKVGHLALRFFDWVKFRPGFSHTTETYNAMIYIAGEARDFGLVEKLVGEMDGELCVKNIKTWTILISQYGVGNVISKALSTFEDMRRSGCEIDSGAYKAIIRALVTGGKGEIAMEFYKEMVSRRIEVIDIDFYELLMNCLSRSGDMAAARAVGDDMIKSMKVPESEGYTCILRSFCISGKIDEARELLEETKRKNVVIDTKAYEILLKGLCRAGRIDEAMEVADNIKQHSVVDNNVYGSLIDGLLRNGDISKAMNLLHGMRELNMLPTVSTYTQIIQHLFRSDEYKQACAVYEEMIENGIEPDVVAITAMVAGHVQHSRISEAWELFDSMKKNGMGPTCKAYSVFIKELCKASKLDDALKLLNEMAASNLNTPKDIVGLVISSLTKKGRAEEAMIVEEISKSSKLANGLQARQVHPSLDDQHTHQENEVSNCSSNQEAVKHKQIQQEYAESDLKELCGILSSSTNWISKEEALQRSTIQFTPELVNQAINSCQRHGCAALKFFAWLRKKASYRHTADAYNLAIKIAGSAKDFKHMRELYHDMRRSGCSVTANTWTIMIAQYGKAGLTEIALNTFKEMKREGCPPNASTFKFLVVFLCGKKGRKVEEAIGIFQEMMNEGFMPDRETLDSYLSALCESGKLVNARRCLKSLIKKGFTKQLGYSLFVKCLCRAGEAEEALTLSKEMEDDGCTMDQFVYGSIVHALLRAGRLDDALDKVEAMRAAGVSESVHIRTSFIVHFCREKQIGKAVEIFNKMREDGCEPTLVTYSAMIRGYMNMGMVSDACDIFRKLKDEGMSPDFETYSMFISCLCQAGESEEGLQLIHEMLERGITPSTVNFRAVFRGLNREGKQDLAHSVLQTKWNLRRHRMFTHKLV